MKRVVVGIVGPIASGKGVVSKLFQKKGFKQYSLSDRIREELRKRKLPENDRLHLQNVGDELRKKFGDGVLAERTIKKVHDDECKKIVLESIRNPGEIRLLRETLKATIIGIDASQKKRFKHLKARNRKGDPKTWKEFVKFDTREISGKRKGYQIQVDRCLQMSDFVIKNEGSKKELATKVEKVMKKFGNN